MSESRQCLDATGRYARSFEDAAASSEGRAQACERGGEARLFRRPLPEAALGSGEPKELRCLAFFFALPIATVGGGRRLGRARPHEGRARCDAAARRKLLLVAIGPGTVQYQICTYVGTH